MSFKFEKTYNMLNESRSAKLVKKYLKSKGVEDYEKQQEIIKTLYHEIPNLKLGNEKFILGALRFYIEDGNLRSFDEKQQLDKTLKYMFDDGHDKDYDENFNGKSFDEIADIYKERAEIEVEEDKKRSAALTFTGDSDYEIIPINDFEEAAEYGKYTKWCVTQDEKYFFGYTHGGYNRFYFCLKKGWKKLKEQKGENCPLDEYGLSMLAVLVSNTNKGQFQQITTRWNHENGGEMPDGLNTPELIEKLINKSFYEAFPPYDQEELNRRGVLKCEDIQKILDKGIKPEVIEKMPGMHNFRISPMKDGSWHDDIGYYYAFVFAQKKDGTEKPIMTNLVKDGKLIFKNWKTCNLMPISTDYILGKDGKLYNIEGSTVLKDLQYTYKYILSQDCKTMLFVEFKTKDGKYITYNIKDNKLMIDVSHCHNGRIENINNFSIICSNTNFDDIKKFWRTSIYTVYAQYFDKFIFITDSNRIIFMDSDGNNIFGDETFEYQRAKQNYYDVKKDNDTYYYIYGNNSNGMFLYNADTDKYAYFEGYNKTPCKHPFIYSTEYNMLYDKAKQDKDSFWKALDGNKLYVKHTLNDLMDYLDWKLGPVHINKTNEYIGIKKINMNICNIVNSYDLRKLLPFDIIGFATDEREFVSELSKRYSDSDTANRFFHIMAPDGKWYYLYVHNTTEDETEGTLLDEQFEKVDPEKIDTSTPVYQTVTHEKKSLDELVNMPYKEIIKGQYDTKDAVSLIMNSRLITMDSGNEEISLYEYYQTNYDNVAYLKISTNELKKTGNDIYIYINENLIKNGLKWDDKLTDTLLYKAFSQQEASNFMDGFRATEKIIHDYGIRQEGGYNIANLYPLSYCYDIYMEHNSYLPTAGQMIIIGKAAQLIDDIQKYTCAKTDKNNLQSFKSILKNTVFWTSTEKSSTEVWGYKFGVGLVPLDKKTGTASALALHNIY